MRLAIAIGLGICLGADAQTDLLKDVRIALRLNDGALLIVGGESQGFAYERSMEELPRAEGYSVFQPVEEIFEPPAEYMKRFTFRPVTAWRRGDRWKLYTGATAPPGLRIDAAGFGYYCGGLGGFATAVARIANAPDIGMVLGLRSSAYLAAPAARFAPVSRTPLVPVETRHEPFPAVENALLLLGRKAVGDESWKTEGRDDVRQMNREFLMSQSLRIETRMQRWSLPGSKPLLLVEAVWSDEKGRPLFGADAVVEESATPRVLSFSPTEGELMRVGETLSSGGWQRPEGGVFLNAWAIGGRRFVLVYWVGYEGFQVELNELVEGKGLVPTGIGFGAGC